MYKLLFCQSKALLRDRKNLLKDKKSEDLIKELLGKLAADPFSKIIQFKKLKSSEEGVFRLRCGNWRIIFDIDTKNKIILIYRIKQRKEGY